MRTVWWWSAVAATWLVAHVGSATGQSSEPSPAADAVDGVEDAEPSPRAAPETTGDGDDVAAHDPADGAEPDAAGEAEEGEFLAVDELEAPVMQELTGRAAAERVLTTGMTTVPTMFLLWRSEDGKSFIKPVVQISSVLVGYFPENFKVGDPPGNNPTPPDERRDLANRASTLLLARLGFEGQLFEYVTFRTVFERNIGYSLTRNGPLGTSVWEGTASLQARENYIRLARWGVSLAGGIVPDPATLDFVSQNVLDTFGMDPYVRDPLLVSGFNQGQGFLLRYSTEELLDPAVFGKFGVGFSYTGGNPLVTSLAFGFGGDVSALGTLFTAPLRALANGIPGSEIHLNVLSPTLTYESRYVDVKLAYQHYLVDVDVTSDEDQRISGYNVRGTAQVKLFDEVVRVFVSGAYRQNDQLAIPDVTTTKQGYEGFVFGAGGDFTWGNFSIGGQYYWLDGRTTPDEALVAQYINVGATYWLFKPNLSVGARWARSLAEARDFTGEDPQFQPRLRWTDSLNLSLRLLI